MAIRIHQPAFQFHQSKPDDPTIHFEEQRHVFLASEKVVQRLSPIDEAVWARLHPRAEFTNPAAVDLAEWAAAILHAETWAAWQRAHPEGDPL